MLLSALSRYHFLSPSIALNPHIAFVLFMLICAFITQIFGLDMWLAQLIYQSQNGDFLRHNLPLEIGFHKGGRYLVIAAVSYFLIRLLLSFSSPAKRRVWGYLFVTTLACIIAISALKQVTRLPCPWDVQEFGGVRDYISAFSAFDSQFPLGHCFPSGHASGGFALLSCYFAFARRNTLNTHFMGVQFNRLWLLPGILTGGLFAVAQQLRGAHFLSHDLTTIALCWFICWGAQRFFFTAEKN